MQGAYRSIPTRAIGYAHAARGPQAFRPTYLPIDEVHGGLPLETYGLSKQSGCFYPTSIQCLPFANKPLLYI